VVKGGQGEAQAESKLSLSAPRDSVPVLVPACQTQSCPTRVELRDRAGALKAESEFNLPYQRRWKVYVSPFSHIDVGFTNSQRKILAQNLDNLRAALKLIEETKDYPESARFKFFTEVSWPTSEFLYSDATTKEEKEKLIAAMKAGQVEVGGFLISHQNKFLPAEALFRSPDTALKINRDYGVPIRTACIDDVMDFSGIVKPLWGAQIPYFIGGANTNHYVVPPLFYLQPPVGNEKILAWITPNLNGYGEDTDFAMKPALPITDASLAEIATRLGPYLRSLETDGVPPKIVRDHFDFYGAHWDYPFDSYLLPYYPAHAVDNGGQDITPSDLAKLWNARWAYPKLIIATPSEFFQQAEAQSQNQIPTLRGELPGFWGEQIFFAMAQTDPERTATEREFERKAREAENGAAEGGFERMGLEMEPATAGNFPDRSNINNLEAKIAEAFKLIDLNNDHNPGPVPFGNTKYTKEDTAEWKSTRRQWIAKISETGSGFPKLPTLKEGPSEFRIPVIVEEDPGSVVMENEFYRVEVDKRTGGISRLLDKELNRDLVGPGPYQFNQYVVIARGEDAGTRGNIVHRPGFKQVKVSVVTAGPHIGLVSITGPLVQNRDAVKSLTRFIREALHLPIPGGLIKGIARLLGIRLGPMEEITQDIVLKSGVKAVFFSQYLKVNRDQIVDHTFVYPLNVPADQPLIVEGAYNPYRFGPTAPLGQGDLIPGAKMTNAKFPGINALTQVFGWMYGMPPDAVFDNYVLAMGHGFGIAFTSDNSGVILPGPLDKDPVKGPFGGGFQHLVLGWTAYGRAFLGAPQSSRLYFESQLTSFDAQDEAEAKIKAANFSRSPLQSEVGYIDSSNDAILITMIRLLADGSLLLRLYESSGTGAEAKIRLPAAKAIVSATRARSDGVPLSQGELPLVTNTFSYRKNGSEEEHTGVETKTFSIKLGPGEVATVRVVAIPRYNP